MRRTSLVPAAIAALLLLSGCAPAIADEDGATRYDCNGRLVERAAFDARMPLGDLDEDGRDALAEALQADGSGRTVSADDGWFVLTRSATSIEVMRASTDTDDQGPTGIPMDHELLAVEKAAQPGEQSAWTVWTSSRCALRLDLDPLEMPRVALADAPDPASTELRLLVTESACNSGQDAEGRIELVALEESDDRVAVTLGVRPRDTGAASCQGNPDTPFTVSLSEPLGDREVVDAGLVLPRAVAVHPATGVEG
jgi:hypothetical protein